MSKYFFLFFLIFSNYTLADISVIDALNFGTIVIVKNTPDTSMTLFPNGATTTRNIHVMQVGQPAELLFEGYGPGVQINVSDTGTQQPMRRVNGGNEFTINNLIFSRTTITTNAYGMATLKIGAQLKTSGNGLNYLDDSYSTTAEITIAY
ncbi:hypothetical protein [Pseudoalteromonas distincta]|uniref:hypothetical protein n=1 Tax=Pseudoalteromonas distincta TaxID=77608 RepID=UPI0032E1B2FB